MASVAEKLREAREKQGLSVYQIAELTKIKTEHVRSLEEGNYNVFAAPIYIRGFVRSYASVTKLDVPSILKDLDAELSQTEKFNEPPSLTGTRQGFLDFLMLQFSKLNWKVGVGIIAVAGVLLLTVGIYKAWDHYMNSDPLAKLGPGLYEPKEPLPQDVLPLPKGP